MKLTTSKSAATLVIAFACLHLPVEAADAPVIHEHQTSAGTIKHDESHEGHSKVHCVDPHACCKESEKVLDTLQTLVNAYIHCDVKTIQDHLDDNCTTFDETTGKLVTGKENVVADLKKKFERYAPNGETPLLNYTIDHPYAKVNGDTAVVTFVAYREIGGKHPVKEKANITDVFVKHNGVWKKLHYRGAWKKITG